MSYNWQGSLKLKTTLPTKKNNEVQMISLKLITSPKLLGKKKTTTAVLYGHPEKNR